MTNIRVEIRQEGKSIVSIVLPPTGLIVGDCDEADICLPGVEKGMFWRLSRHGEGMEISIFSDTAKRRKVKTKTVVVGDRDKLGPYELGPVVLKRKTKEPTKKLVYDTGHKTLLIQSVELTIKSSRDGPVQTISLPEGRSVLGKDPACDIVLNDAFVSARHMALNAVNGRILAEDLGSRNGVFIEGQKISGAQVVENQVITIGETQISIRSTEKKELIDKPARNIPGFVGECDAIRQVTALVDRVAPTDVTVLVEGETGTGKEVVARGVHALSGRLAGPFIPVNCSAIPKDLFESELFGHAKGAFTGAQKQRRGLFSLAAEGTLFLDEISELPMDMQARLLRVLDDRRIRPVGSEHEIQCDVRIVAATNKNLEELVMKKAFRDDLLYRLRMVPVLLPPLRTRGKDVELLATHFLESESGQLGKSNPGLAPSAREALNNYNWPGNVRELKACIIRALVMNPSDAPIDKNNLFIPHIENRDSGTLRSIEEQAIRQALLEEQTREQAARRLGIAPSTLYEKIKKYNL